MGNEWPRLTLREAHVRLIDCDHRTPPAADSGYPYVAIPQLSDGRIDIASARRISYTDFVDWTRRAAPAPDDIVLSRRTNPGVTAFVPDGLEFALGQNLVLLRSDGTVVFPPFLRWLVRGPDWWEQIGRFLNVGAVFDSLKCIDIPNFRLPIPPLPEQRRIADILGALDDKIELNRRMNQTLDSIVRALFKSWFVDFDPVRAKSEGRDTGLPPHLAGQFPDSFEDSELGEIPNGWRVSGLDEIATFLNGLALQKYPPDHGGSLPVVKIAQLRTGNTVGADRASADIPPAYVVEDGDVLFSWSGSLEIEIWCGGRGALNQHLFKVTSSTFPKWFYLLWTRHHLADFRGIAAGKATTMGHIQRGHLSAARALVPPPRLVEAMSAHFEPLLDDLIAGRLQSRILVALRDALIPKLIAGEIRVRDAERSLEEARR